MAESAANFTKISYIKPSILEVIAQISLNETLYPAFERTCLFLATNFPQRFGWLNSFHDEAFLVLNGVLEYFYLKQFDASFSENFYGLKRILGNGNGLTNQYRNISFTFIVILPYLRRKVKDKHYMTRLENADGLLKKTFTGYCKLLLLYTYSLIELMWGVFTVRHYIMYMSNQTEFQTPSLKFQDIKLTYDDAESLEKSLWQAYSAGELSVSQFCVDAIRRSLLASLGIGAFFLQFINSWNIQKINYDMRDLPQVPAPPLDNKSSSLLGKCPLCYKFWITPTVLQVSGYIFCFRCILKYLNEHQKCPVTNLPAKQLNIIRLYTS